MSNVEKYQNVIFYGMTSNVFLRQEYQNLCNKKPRIIFSALVARKSPARASHTTPSHVPRTHVTQFLTARQKDPPYDE